MRAHIKLSLLCITRGARTNKEISDWSGKGRLQKGKIALERSHLVKRYVTNGARKMLIIYFNSACVVRMKGATPLQDTN